MSDEPNAVVKRDTTVTMEKGLPNAEQLKNMLDGETKRQTVLDGFIKDNLRKDEDFGVIPGTTKPTLYKAGAEKVLSLFNLRAEWSKDTDTLEMLKLDGTVAFKCLLINRATNLLVGEGRGVALPKEKSSWTANTQVKICEKRALVDAVLVTFGLSSRYTQDMEDHPKRTVNNDAVITNNQVNLIRKLLKETETTELSLMKNHKLRCYKFLEDTPFIMGQAIIESLLKKKNAQKVKTPAGMPDADAETGEIINDIPDANIVDVPDDTCKQCGKELSEKQLDIMNKLRATGMLVNNTCEECVAKNTAKK
jgi:hypothetical protein